jgi:hypothetical protein
MIVPIIEAGGSEKPAKLCKAFSSASKRLYSSAE